MLNERHTGALSKLKEAKNIIPVKLNLLYVVLLPLSVLCSYKFTKCPNTNELHHHQQHCIVIILYIYTDSDRKSVKDLLLPHSP